MLDRRQGQLDHPTSVGYIRLFVKSEVYHYGKPEPRQLADRVIEATAGMG